MNTEENAARIVEEMDSTTVIYPGQEGEMDPYGNIIIRERGK